MKRVLLVDDEPLVLDGLQRLLHPMRGEWVMLCAASGRAALDLLAQQPVDVVVTDMRMPEMDGAELLLEVSRRHPQVVRIVLSGQCDEETTLRLVPVTHQYLAKPCDPAMLRSAVARACALDDLLDDGALKQAVNQMPALPSLPALYAQLMKELRSPDASVARAGDIIAGDVAMSARLLQLVNSAFFGLPSRITTPQRAASLLGLQTIQALVLSVGVFSQFDQKHVRAFRIEAIMRHSVATGAMARLIAQSQRQPRNRADDAFLAGIMHDVGKLVLAAALPERYQESLARAGQAPACLCETEREVFGTSHAEVGAYLLGLWGLPDSVVEAVAFHHRPAASPDRAFAPLTAVHVADILEHTLGSPETAGPVPQPAVDYLQALGVADRLPAWWDACQRACQGWNTA